MGFNEYLIGFLYVDKEGKKGIDRIFLNFSDPIDTVKRVEYAEDYIRTEYEYKKVKILSVTFLKEEDYL